MKTTFPELDANEVATLIHNDDIIGFSGFTAAGAAKEVPKALAARAVEEHAAGRPFRVGVVAGASTGPSLDGELARARAVKFRTPYQSDPDLRKSINAGETDFFDLHLSLLPQYVRYGYLGKFNWAVIEACDVKDNGEITLTSSVGTSPTFCQVADKIVIELNRFHPKELHGFHDIYQPLDPPHRREIPICKPSDRIGSPVLKVDPKKIVGIVRTNKPDESGRFSELNDTTKKIGENVANFLANEIRCGRVPKEFLPIQSGVGDTANAVLAALGQHPDIPQFEMYTEVIQDAVIDLMREEKVKFGSTCSLTVAPDVLKEIYADLDYFRSRLVLRPQEMSNNPEVIRRLGLISANTAIEVDLGGNVNSTHLLGRKMMNGIGGSGDFARNAYLSIFTCPSTTKKGLISTIVPMVSHLDHSEHSVQIIVTEQGVADLRGKSPRERANLIIDQCAHPEFRPQLKEYLAISKGDHTPQVLQSAFGMHIQFSETGDMRRVSWRK